MNRIFDKERCTGCGICTMNCPLQILDISTTKKNIKGKPISYIVDQSKCTNCMICSKVCPYLAITFEDDHKKTNFPKLMKGIDIPFHNGCSQGLIERLIAETIEELKVEDKIIIFKADVARFNVNVDVRGYSSNDYFNNAIEYKKNNSDKIVLVWYVDEEPWQHKQAINDFKELKNSSVTIIHMLNYFSNIKLNPDSNEYSKNVCEMLINSKEVSFVARGGFKDVRTITETKFLIKKSILSQLKGSGFSFLELIFPCHWRLECRTDKEIVSSQVIYNIEWFNRNIYSKYPLGIFREI